MTAQLDHTIVYVRDRAASAAFLSEILGLAEPKEVGPFLAVPLGNGVTLDFANGGDDVATQHYAFLISEAEFDEIFGRIQQRGLDYWADPYRTHPGEIRERWGGRGLYFEEPSGHFLEILTHPEG